MSDPQDRVPFISSWRSRTKDLNKRPWLLKQLVFLAALVLLALPLRYLALHNDAHIPSQEHLVAISASPTLGYQNDVTYHAPPPTAPATSDTVAEHAEDFAPPNGVSHKVSNTVSSPMAFSLIMWGTDSAAEGAILLKSILMYTSGPVDFHIICDEDAQVYLEKRLALVNRPRYDVLVRFYRPTWQAMLDRIEREGTIRSVHAAGTRLMKLFIHEILPPSVMKTVFVDTDAFFISDPYLLWEHFRQTLSPSTVISMPTHPEMFAQQWFDANKICSCVMLMDLNGLRRLRLMDSSYYRAATPSPLSAYSPAAFRALFGPPNERTGKYEEIALGDQSYWWAIIQHMNRDEEPQKGMFAHLHYDWEISSCLADMYITDLEPGRDDATDEDELKVQLHTWMTPHQGEVIRPKLVHFNCLPGPRYYEWPGWDSTEDEHAAGTEGLARRWGTSIKYHIGYKWLWLNRGVERPAAALATDDNHGKTRTAKFTVETVMNVKFADELYGEMQDL